MTLGGLTLAIHVADEALTGFLAVYNPTVIALRERFSWFPMPVFRFETWLGGLILLVLVLLSLSPFAFRGASWLRPLAYVFAVVMVANGLGHTAGTIFGRTVESVRFPRPMPGFYSSPALLAACSNTVQGNDPGAGASANGGSSAASGGAAGNWFLQHRGPTMTRGTYSPGFRLALILIDCSPTPGS